jgi:hypothetical protein
MTEVVRFWERHRLPNTRHLNERGTALVVSSYGQNEGCLLTTSLIYCILVIGTAVPGNFFFLQQGPLQWRYLLPLMNNTVYLLRGYHLNPVVISY